MRVKILSSTCLTLLLLTAVSALSGCVSTEEKGSLSELKSRSMSVSEINELLVGNTYPFGKGGIYLSSTTEATAIWEGKTEDTTWYATDNSSFCYTLDLFGGKEECLGLVKTADGNFIQDWEGSKTAIKSVDIKEGKTF